MPKNANDNEISQADLIKFQEIVSQNNVDELLYFLTTKDFISKLKVGAILTIPEKIKNIPKKSNNRYNNRYGNNNNNEDEETKSINKELPWVNLTPMHIAAYYDALECFVILEERGFSYEMPSADGYLPLHYACAGGSMEIASFIESKMEGKPSQNKSISGNNMIPILFLATMSGHPDLVTLIFNCGFTYDPKVYQNYNPFEYAIKVRNISVLHALLKRAQLDSSGMKDTPIMRSIRLNQPDTLSLLIEYGDDPGKIIETEKNDYESAICLLCRSLIDKKENVMRLLIDKIIQVDIPEDKMCPGAVHWICESRNPAIVAMVLEKGIHVNRFDHYGLPGPSRLVDVNDTVTIEILKLLLTYGYNINGIAPIKGAKPLIVHFMNAIFISPKIIELLLMSGADPLLEYEENGETMTPYKLSRNISDLMPIFRKYVVQ